MKQFIVPAGTAALVVQDGPLEVPYQTRKASTFSPGEVVVDPVGDVAASLEGALDGVHGPASPTVGGARARAGYYGFARRQADAWVAPVLLVPRHLVHIREVAPTKESQP